MFRSLLLSAEFDQFAKTLVIPCLALIAVWVIFAIVVAALGKKSEKLNLALRISSLVVVGLAVIVGIILLVAKIKEKGFAAGYMIPVAGIIAAVVGCTLFAVIAGSKNPEKASLYRKTALLVFIVIFAVCAVFIYVYVNKSEDVPENVQSIALIVSAVILVAIPVVVMAGTKDQLNTKSIVFGAVSVALSFALSYWAPWKLPQGGSVTIASLTPLLLYSFYFGPRKGVVVCFAYGLLQAIQDPYIVHPAQFLIDYPVAYCFIGFAGVFRKLIKNEFVAFVCGSLAASVMRFVCHVISGVFAFVAYAPAGQTPLLYSIGYNSFVFVDIAIAVVVGVALMCSKDLRRMLSTYAEENK